MIKIHFQNEDIVIVEKTPHILVHPNKKLNNDKHSLLDLVANQLDSYIYPIHRLDRPVSGIVTFALNKSAAKNLSQAWTTDLVKKKYLALVRGKFYSPSTLNFPLKHKKKNEYQDAITHYKPIQAFKDSTYIEVVIETGRYHQIRRHFARTVNHVLGDRTHGKKKYNDFYLENFNLERIFLHSYNLKIDQSIIGVEIEVTSPLPDDLALVIEKIRNK